MSPPRRGSTASRDERDRDDRRSEKRVSEAAKASSTAQRLPKAQESPKDLPIETVDALADLFVKVADSTSTISYLKNQRYLADQELLLSKIDPTTTSEESDEKFPSVKEFYQASTAQAEKRIRDVKKQYESSNRELKNILIADTPRLLSSLMQSALAGGGTTVVQNRIEALEKLVQEKDKTYEKKLIEQQETINKAMDMITRLEQDRKDFARDTTTAIKRSIEQDMAQAKRNAAIFEKSTEVKLQEMSDQSSTSKANMMGQVSTLQQQIKELQGASSRVEQSQAKLEATMFDSIKQVSERATKTSSSLEILVASTTSAAKDVKDLKKSVDTLKAEAANKASQFANLESDLTKLDARLQKVETPTQNDNISNLKEDLDNLKSRIKKVEDRASNADTSTAKKDVAPAPATSSDNLLQVEDRIMKKVDILQASVNGVTDIIGSTVEYLVADAIKEQASRLSTIDAKCTNLEGTTGVLSRDLKQLHEASGIRFNSLEPRLAEFQLGLQQVQQNKSTSQELEGWQPFLLKLKNQWIPAHEMALTQLRERADNIMSADVVQAMLDCLSQNHPGLDIKGQWLKNLDEHHKALVDHVWKLDAKIRGLESALGQSEVTIQLHTDRIGQLEPNGAKDTVDETLTSLQSLKTESETQIAALTQKLSQFEEAIDSIKKQQEKEKSEDLKKILQKELETIYTRQASILSTAQQAESIAKTATEMVEELKTDNEKKASKEEFDALKKQVDDNEQLASDYVAASRRIAEKVEEKLVTEVEKLGKKIETEIETVEERVGIKLGEVESRVVKLGAVEERVETKLKEVEERLSKTISTITSKPSASTNTVSSNRSQSPSRSSTSSSRPQTSQFNIRGVANTNNSKSAITKTALAKTAPPLSNSNNKRRHVNGTPDHVNGHSRGNSRNGPPNKKPRRNHDDDDEDIRPQLSDDADE